MVCSVALVCVGCFSAGDPGETLGGESDGVSESSEGPTSESANDTSEGPSEASETASDTSEGPGDTSDTSDTTTSEESSDTTSEDTGPVDTEPPTLEFGAFIDSTHIRLTFSEPIASVAGVNPAKFRPSEAWWDSDDSGMVYLDLLNDFPDNSCPCITGAGLQNDPNDAYAIIVQLSAPTNAWTCMNADYNYLPVMHYDADTLGTAEHIRDLAGNELGEFGGQFVASSNLSSLVIPARSPFPDFPLGHVWLDYAAICP